MPQVFEATYELTVPVGTEDTFSIDVGPFLDPGVLASGTPAIVEDTTTDLTITNKAVNTAALTINYNNVAIGKGIQFYALGFVAGTRYKIIITFTTDATPTGARVAVCYINTKAT